MATKRTVVRGTSGKQTDPKKIVRGFSKKAKEEISELLKRDRAGTLSSKELKHGLKEVKEQLRDIDIHLGHI